MIYVFPAGNVTRVCGSVEFELRLLFILYIPRDLFRIAMFIIILRSIGVDRFQSQTIILQNCYDVVIKILKS